MIQMASNKARYSQRREAVIVRWSGHVPWPGVAEFFSLGRSTRTSILTPMIVVVLLTIVSVAAIGFAFFCRAMAGVLLYDSNLGTFQRVLTAEQKKVSQK